MIDDILMPEEVKAYIKEKETINAKTGYEMIRIIDIDRNTIERPDGEEESDTWVVTTYNVTSGLMHCKSWIIFHEAGERKVITKFVELPMAFARKIARKIEGVA